ncbi:MAG: FtsX-like permease family protein [Blastocatellia bacterium]|nr:FtsX-like permease family protein [Blastocatellia bacterium]
MSALLRRAGWRYLLGHPWQFGLSIVGVALGVAVVISIDLANSSAEQAFTLSAEAVMGRATHHIVGGPSGVPEELYSKLRVELGIRLTAPVVEGYGATPDDDGQALRVLGIDPFAEQPFRPYLSSSAPERPVTVSALLTQPGAVLMSSHTAERLGLKAGDMLPLQIGATRHTAHLIGLLEPSDAISRRAMDNLLMTDIATAQEWLDMRGRLSRIDLRLSDDGVGEQQLRRIGAALPAGVEIVPAGAQSQALAQMTRAFRFNLTAMSLLALIVGMFLIYNTMTFSVVQRRALIGILRAIGVTRAQVFKLILSESLLIAGIGTIAGILFGIVLARGLIGLVTQTINDLYFVVSVSELSVAPLSLIKGIALGLGASVLAALVPAVEATTAPPRAVESRSHIEGRWRRAVPRAAYSGVASICLGAALLAWPSRNLLMSYGAFFVIILGCALLTPAATVGLMRALGSHMRRLFGILGAMAARDVVAALSRTAVAIAALMIALATTVGVGVMIHSFRGAVARWLDTSLHADIYVSSPSLVARRNQSTLPAQLIERLAAVPGVAVVNTYRGVTVNTARGLTELVALGLDPRSYAAFNFKEGDPQQIWPAFQHGGAVIVSEPYAYHHRLTVGSTIALPTDYGEQVFPIVGIFYDYGSDHGIVMMSRRTYDRWWHDRKVTSLGIYAEPGVEIEALMESLRRQLGGQDVSIRPNRAIREASLDVFDRTFAITRVLRVLAMGVAFIGVLSALMAMQLERAREMAVLRANGLTPRQVWRLITLKTGLMGLVAGVLAMPIGTLLAALLVFVINRRSFGWTMQLEATPELLLQAPALALVAAMLAGLYPALNMARTSPALALRAE